MGSLANCPRCSALFLAGTVAICNQCRNQEEQNYQKVYAFMRKKQNRMAAVKEIEVATGVSEKQIREFVKQKRLHPAQFPNISYLCEKCERPIQDGRICERCKMEITKALKRHESNKELESKKRGKKTGLITRWKINNKMDLNAESFRRYYKKPSLLFTKRGDPNEN
ncbi:TIGR03826 family flagellar region protein [Halobacillus halophilus]|uniref:TIGR03826 family flagellar region protein n=1 Tax=Halobacillus halophilus TaxID=1570 RepID=UPI001CD2A4E8|nr:TIGR03826 family flagellar region protein [Halobacillus halophilus]MCA1011251.1 flagellar protein YvyF [Halobacillus halophilus]